MDTGVKFGRDVMAAIGRELRVRYADIVAEGVPEQFAEILRRLDESSGEGAKRDDPASR
jgi:Anti-sigma factor NepR